MRLRGVSNTKQASNNCHKRYMTHVLGISLITDCRNTTQCKRGTLVRADREIPCKTGSERDLGCARERQWGLSGARKGAGKMFSGWMHQLIELGSCCVTAHHARTTGT